MNTNNVNNTADCKCIKIWNNSMEISKFPGESTWRNCESHTVDVPIGGKRGSAHQLVSETSDVLLTCLQWYLPQNSFSLKPFLY